jgi:hypothetical protein
MPTSKSSLNTIPIAAAGRFTEPTITRIAGRPPGRLFFLSPQRGPVPHRGPGKSRAVSATALPSSALLRP